MKWQTINTSKCYRQKICLIFSKHNSVLVFLVGQKNPKCSRYKQRLLIDKITDIIRKEPRRQVKIYLQRVFLPPPLPVLANIHSILAYDVPRRTYRGCGPTHEMPVQCWASILAYCWFNACQPSTTLGLLYTSRKHLAFTQCCFNVDPQSSTLARH